MNFPILLTATENTVLSWTIQSCSVCTRIRDRPIRSADLSCTGTIALAIFKFDTVVLFCNNEIFMSRPALPVLYMHEQPGSGATGQRST